MLMLMLFWNAQQALLVHVPGKIVISLQVGKREVLQMVSFLPWDEHIAKGSKEGKSSDIWGWKDVSI